MDFLLVTTFAGAERFIGTCLTTEILAGKRR
jgi:hypothetical protein